MTEPPIEPQDAASAGTATPPAGAASITLVQAIRAARDAVQEFTSMPVDAVWACSRDGDEWSANVDVVESPARLGDNDMLASYEVRLDRTGAVTGFSRIARYNRADAANRG